MPSSPVHKLKRSKNLFIFFLVLLWCLLIYVVTMVKMAYASGMPDKFAGQRQKHQEVIEQTWEKYDRQDAKHQESIVKTWEKYDRQGEAHQKQIEATWEKYDSDGEKHQNQIEATWERYDRQGEKHQREIDKMVERWWYGDLMSDQAKEVMAVKNGQDPFAK